MGGAEKIAAVRGFLGVFGLLALRGLLLWIVVPVETLLWLLLSPWFVHRRVSLRRFLGWADQNLIAALQRSLFRPLFSECLNFVPVRDMGTVTHRVQ